MRDIAFKLPERYALCYFGEASHYMGKSIGGGCSVGLAVEKRHCVASRDRCYFIFRAAREETYACDIRMRIFSPALLAVPRSAVYSYMFGGHLDKRFIAVYDAHALSENFFPEGSVRAFSSAGRRCEKICFSVCSDGAAMEENYASVRKSVA